MNGTLLDPNANLCIRSKICATQKQYLIVDKGKHPIWGYVDLVSHVCDAVNVAVAMVRT